MKPVLPMEPRLSKTIPDESDWLAQVKWDGVRQLIYNDGQTLRIFNRKLRERTAHYPELLNFPQYCSATSAVLDGEVIALGPDGKPDFHQVMKRDGMRRTERISYVQQAVPIIYMVFDILYFNGAWITNAPLEERQEALNRCIIPSHFVQLVSSHEDGAAVFQAIKGQGMEGIIMKRKNSVYSIGRKVEDWLKIKNYHDLTAVIGGYTLNGEIVNAVLLGLYDAQGRFNYIGHSGTGKLSRRDWVELTRMLASQQVPLCPFAMAPKSSQGVHWVLPRMTARIQYIEWHKGHSLRQPSIQALTNELPRECVFHSDLMR